MLGVATVGVEQDDVGPEYPGWMPKTTRWDLDGATDGREGVQVEARSKAHCSNTLSGNGK